MKHLIFPAIALLYTTTLQETAIAQRQDEYERQVNNQLERAIQMARGEGFQLSLPRNVGKLAKGVSAPKTVMLYSNREYNFVAVCDTNCSDINLMIQDGEGKQIASDVTGDAIAVVNLKPPSTERYQVIVKMEQCSKDSCNFGLGIFSKDGEKALPQRRARMR